MPTIYECDDVKAVRRLHQDILDNTYLYSTAAEQLVLFSENLYKAHKNGNPDVRIEISNGHPQLIGKAAAEILAFPLKLEDAQIAIARVYGYHDWDDVIDRGERTFDPDFERAVDFLLMGDIDSLRSILQSHPHLLNQQSPYGHQARLVHYVASNGVEIWRQVIPHNLTAMLDMLLEMGADIQASHNIYGGGGNLTGLIQSSAHPHDAGIADSLIARISHLEG